MKCVGMYFDYKFLINCIINVVYVYVLQGIL